MPAAAQRARKVHQIKVGIIRRVYPSRPFADTRGGKSMTQRRSAIIAICHIRRRTKAQSAPTRRASAAKTELKWSPQDEGGHLVIR